MKGVLAILLAAFFQIGAMAQTSIKAEAPNMVGVGEQFNVTFIIDGETRPSDFSWNAGADFQVLWGPQTGFSTSTQIVNGKRTKSSQYTYTYVLMASKAGTYSLSSATATVDGNKVSSSALSIEVVNNGNSSSSSSGSSSGSASSGSSASGGSVSATGDIAKDDLFMRFTISKTSAVIGEPITATLKLYQRVDIAGFENAKFPSFNGFWSQETEAPTNIEFKRESMDDKIYNTAVLRSYVLIPQQAGDLVIDPAELVCLVNMRVASKRNSIFDSFFDNDYRTVRKRITTSPVTVHVRQVPAGAPATYGGGVGQFTISAGMSKDSLKTHDAASLTVTLSGRGNVSLLEAPKVSFPPDFEVYDTKTTERTSAGGTNGSKTFEYPFIPRSYGDFTIPPIEYSYYDVNAGKYVTLTTKPMEISVAKSAGDDLVASPSSVMQIVERKGVKNLGEDIRYIVTRHTAFSSEAGFFVATPLFWLIAAILILAAVLVYILFRGMESRRADVAGTKNRRATRMALKRLRQAGEYLKKDLYSAFYEELHKALLGFISDKLYMQVEDLSKENIAAQMLDGGVKKELVDKFVNLLDECEYTRYSPDSGNEAMSGHFDDAVNIISSISAGMKTHKSPSGAVKAATLVFGLMMFLPATSRADEKAYRDSLWDNGVSAYAGGDWATATAAFEELNASGVESVDLYYNMGNSYFKGGEYHKAILNYERALRIDPSAADVRYNLEFANTFIQDRIEEVPEFILKTWLRKICYICPSNGWATLSIIFLAAFLVMILLFLLGSSSRTSRTGFYLAIVCFVFLLLSFSFARWQRRDYVRADTAIVMKPVSSVKSAPSAESSRDLFILHEGTKVSIIDVVGDWTNIELADGRQGWIQGTDIEVI